MALVEAMESRSGNQGAVEVRKEVAKAGGRKAS